MSRQDSYGVAIQSTPSLRLNCTPEEVAAGRALLACLHRARGKIGQFTVRIDSPHHALDHNVLGRQRIEKYAGRQFDLPP